MPAASSQKKNLPKDKVKEPLDFHLGKQARQSREKQLEDEELLFEEHSEEVEERQILERVTSMRKKISLQPILASRKVNRQILYAIKRKVVQGSQILPSMLYAKIPGSDRSKTHFYPLPQDPPKRHAVLRSLQ